jgi:hypothetical protein
MTDIEINGLIERVDSAFEEIGQLDPERAQFMWIALAKLMRVQMNSQLSAFLDLAEEHSRSGEKSDELSAARAFLDSENIKRIIAKCPYDKTAFVQNLVRAALSTEGGLDYESGFSILSDSIWWLGSSGVSAEAIELALMPCLSKPDNP